MKLLFCFLLLAIGHVAAKKVINLPFDNDPDTNIRFNFTLGTPAQNVTFYLYERDAQTEADVVGVNSHASSTFEALNPLYDEAGNPVGVNATDVFTLGEEGLGIELPFRYYDAPYGWSYTTAFGLNHPADGSLSFVQNLLASFEEKTVVFSYDYVTDKWPLYAWGLATIGGRAEDRCADDWIIQPEAPWLIESEQWAMTIDELNFGVQTYDSPGRLFFQQGDWNLWMPGPYVEGLLKALGVQDGSYVPCDVQLELVFSVGGGEIRVTPDEYLDRSQQETASRCSLRIYPAEYEQFMLPRSTFQKHCVLRDYSDFTIGFATRLPSN